MNKLSEHFSLEEMTVSQAAARHGIKNIPGNGELDNLKLLCSKVLEPFRDLVGPLKVSSGFRCVQVNKLIGGVATSQHCKGQAADLIPYKTSIKEAYLALTKSAIPFDQAIFEFGSWVHVSFSPTPRKQCLVAYHDGSKTVYSPLNVYGVDKLQG